MPKREKADERKLGQTALEERYLGMVRDVIRRGRVEFEDDSRKDPSRQTIEEILAEFVDVAGWSFVLFQRVAALADGAAEIDPKLGDVVKILRSSLDRLESVAAEGGTNHATFVAQARRYLEDRGLVGGSDAAVEKVARFFDGMVVDAEYAQRAEDARYVVAGARKLRRVDQGRGDRRDA